MSYRKIDPRMWDDERFVALSPEAKLVWLCILTGPQTTALPGLSSCGLATLSEVSRYGIDTVSKAIAELSAAGMVSFNPTCRVLSVPNAPKYNPCANAKVLTGWFSLWKNIPECVEKYNHIARLHASVEPIHPWAETAWAATFGRVSVPSRYGIDTVSISGAVSGAVTVPPTGVQGGSPPAANAAPSPPGVPPSAVHPVPEATRRPKGARKPTAPTPDSIPLPGTAARGVYEALLADSALRPIVGNPGDFAARVSDPDAYPGVNVLAEVKRAGEYAAANPGKHSDGRAYLRNWLSRKAGDVARAPKPASGPAQRPAVSIVRTPDPVVTPEEHAKRVAGYRATREAIAAEAAARKEASR